MLHQVPRRRIHSGHFAAVIAAAVLGLAAFSPALAAGASARVPVTSAGPGVLAGRFARAPVPVLLINGDRLYVQPDPAGVPHAVVASHVSMPVLALRIRGATYYLPADAIPYLGRGLDASLFAIGSLERLEAGGRLPVRLRFAGAVHAVPGIRITRVRGRAASGYLTAASAKVFGRALARQFATGHARGSYGAAGLFSGVSIALAGAASTARGAAPVTPQFPMHTVTVRGSNEWGRPDSGDLILLLNADNPGFFGDPYESFSFFYHGSARYSVPAGHYWAVAWFLVKVRQTYTERIVVLPQFTVAGSNTRVHLSARSATSKVSIRTPRPAAVQNESLTIARYSRIGQAVSNVVSLLSSAPTWISPVKKKPSVGTIRSYTGAQLFSTARKGVPYFYNLAFTGPPGIIPSQRFVVTPASLATVHERYYSSTRVTTHWASFGGNPNQFLFPYSFYREHGNGLATDYFSGGSSYFWETSVNTGDERGGQDDTLHTLLPGQDLTENWNEYPLHPQPYYQLLTGSLAREFPVAPTAFRAGNEVWFLPVPFSDNNTQFGHDGNAAFTAKYKITQNGRLIGRGAFPGYARAKVRRRPSVIRFSLAATLTHDPLTALSPVSYTVWTVRSQAEPHAVVPRSWTCVTVRFALTRKCVVLPILTLNYQVSGLGLNGETPAGAQSIAVSVGYLPQASRSPIVSATAKVSWDNGLTWQPATVTATSAGHYAVTFDAQAGKDVTLRFTAADAAGGSVTETISNAYAVGPGA